MSDKPWFAIDSCGDREYFATAREAKQTAISHLDVERDNAADGWNDEVHLIAWGRVHGTCVETLRRDRTDDDVAVPPGCNEIVDYDIIDSPVDRSGLVEFAKWIAKQQAEFHACTTGDCPHYLQPECSEGLVSEYLESKTHE